jgi:hypothetical protein
LEHLKGLTRLQTLDVSNARISIEGVKKLQQALPNCLIVDFGPIVLRRRRQ